MKLTAYVIDGHTVDIRPAPVERAWMDNTDQRYVYRCLPLSIANAHGWEILCSAGFTAVWDGGKALEDVKVTPDPGTQAPALGHFGHGVLTFHVSCLFRTEPGYDLMVQGPVNAPKEAISPLTGIIETDWSPFSFTMNWLFTRPGAPVRFEKGEPFCHLMPVRRGELETFEPELRLLSENPELEHEHKMWTANRSKFNADLREPGSEAQAEKWQKLYHRGVGAGGAPSGIDDHRTRLKLKPFARPGG
jgi:hypothetical protein